MGHQVQDRGKNRWHFPPTSPSSTGISLCSVLPFLVPYMSSGICASLCSGESLKARYPGRSGVLLTGKWLGVLTMLPRLLKPTPQPGAWPLGKVVMCTQGSRSELPEVPPALARGEHSDGVWLLLDIFERRGIGATVKESS